jgi:SAM-dependent methyltransferase
MSKDPISRLVNVVSTQARQKRGQIFRTHFRLDGTTKILDLGSENGAHIHSVLRGTPVDPRNVYIADLDPAAIEEGQRRYHFNPVLICESEPLPFPERFFDVVYCSSVLEHVTVPKKDVWTLYSAKEFKKRAALRQRAFAHEVARLGKGYFVQTPYRYFPIETHTWLPFVGWIPRRALIPFLRLSNRIWVKRTSPDWRLLTIRELSEFFPGATIIEERAFGLVKSIMAIKAN